MSVCVCSKVIAMKSRAGYLTCNVGVLRPSVSNLSPFYTVCNGLRMHVLHYVFQLRGTSACHRLTVFGFH